MTDKYVPYSAFATKTVFDLRRMSVIQSGMHAGQLEVHIGPRPQEVVLPGGRGFAVQGKFDSIGNWTRGLQDKYCLVAGFQEVFQLVSCFDAGDNMCLVLRPLGVGLGFRSLLASKGRRSEKLTGTVAKLRAITHARVNQGVGSKLQLRRGIAAIVAERNKKDIVVPLDAWTIGEALQILDLQAAQIRSQGWRSHRGGYCEECGCNMSDVSRRWEFHRDGDRMSLYLQAVETQS